MSLRSGDLLFLERTLTSLPVHEAVAAWLRRKLLAQAGAARWDDVCLVYVPSASTVKVLTLPRRAGHLKLEPYSEWLASSHAAVVGMRRLRCSEETRERVAAALREVAAGTTPPAGAAAKPSVRRSEWRAFTAALRRARVPAAAAAAAQRRAAALEAAGLTAAAALYAQRLAEALARMSDFFNTHTPTHADAALVTQVETAVARMKYYAVAPPVPSRAAPAVSAADTTPRFGPAQFSRAANAAARHLARAAALPYPVGAAARSAQKVCMQLEAHFAATPRTNAEIAEAVYEKAGLLPPAEVDASPPLPSLPVDFEVLDTTLAPAGPAPALADRHAATPYLSNLVYIRDDSAEGAGARRAVRRNR